MKNNALTDRKMQINVTPLMNMQFFELVKNSFDLYDDRAVATYYQLLDTLLIVFEWWETIDFSLALLEHPVKIDQISITITSYRVIKQNREET